MLRPVYKASLKRAQLLSHKDAHFPWYGSSRLALRELEPPTTLGRFWAPVMWSRIETQSAPSAIEGALQVRGLFTGGEGS